MLEKEKEILEIHREMCYFLKNYVNELREGKISSKDVLERVERDLRQVVDFTVDDQIKGGLKRTIDIVDHLKEISLEDLHRHIAVYETSLNPEEVQALTLSDLHRILLSIQLKEKQKMEDPVYKALGSLSQLFGGCHSGDGISMLYGLFRRIGKPCLRERYEATSDSEELKSQILMGNVSEKLRPIASAIDAYLSQCDECPYKAFFDKVYKEKTNR